MIGLEKKEAKPTTRIEKQSGESVELKCDGEAAKLWDEEFEVKVTWKLGEKDVNVSNSISVSDEGQVKGKYLKLSNLKESDFGIYACTGVTDFEEKTSRTFELVLVGKSFKMV